MPIYSNALPCLVCIQRSQVTNYCARELFDTFEISLDFLSLLFYSFFTKWMLRYKSRAKGEDFKNFNITPNFIIGLCYFLGKGRFLLFIIVSNSSIDLLCLFSQQSQIVYWYLKKNGIKSHTLLSVAGYSILLYEVAKTLLGDPLFEKIAHTRWIWEFCLCFAVINISLGYLFPKHNLCYFIRACWAMSILMCIIQSYQINIQ